MGYAPRPGLPGYWEYDGLPVQADRETHEFVVRWARDHLAPGASVLDIAAGRGALSKALLDAGFAVSCTSWDGKVGLPIPTYFCDVDLPFDRSAVGGQAYDLVCAIEIIEHSESPAGLLRSCATLVDRGGTLIVSTPNVEHALARLQWLIRGRPASFGRDEIERNRHISLLWREGIEHLIAQAGLQVAGKHFTGSARLGSGLLAWGKRAIVRLMEAVLPGELSGTTRLYVLTRGDRTPGKTGPGDVY